MIDEVTLKGVDSQHPLILLACSMHAINEIYTERVIEHEQKIKVKIDLVNFMNDSLVMCCTSVRKFL